VGRGKQSGAGAVDKHVFEETPEVAISANGGTEEDSTIAEEIKGEGHAYTGALVVNLDEKIVPALVQVEGMP